MWIDSASEQQLERMRRNETISIAVSSLKDSMRRRGSGFAAPPSGGAKAGQGLLATPGDGLASRRDSVASQYLGAGVAGPGERRPSILPFLSSTNSIRIMVNGGEPATAPSPERTASSAASLDTDVDADSDYCYPYVASAAGAAKKEPSRIELVRARYEEAMIAMGSHQQQQRLLQQQKQEAEMFARRGSVASSSRRYSYCFAPPGSKLLGPDTGSFFSKKKKHSTASSGGAEGDSSELDDERRDPAAATKIPVVKNASRDLKFSNILSDDGQCAILKTYEDEMYKQIKMRLPRKSIPRISTPIFNMKLSKKHRSGGAGTTSGNMATSTASPSPSSSTSSMSSSPSTPPASAKLSSTFLKATPVKSPAAAHLPPPPPSVDAQKTAEINKQIRLAMQILDDLARHDRKQSTQADSGTGAGGGSRIQVIKERAEPRPSLVSNNGLFGSRRQSRRLSISTYSKLSPIGGGGGGKESNGVKTTNGGGNSSDDLHAIVKKYEMWHSNWCKMFNNLF